MTKTAMHMDVARNHIEHVSASLNVVERFQTAMRRGERTRAMDGLFHGMSLVRKSTTPAEWKAITTHIRREASLWTLRDLLTYRCVAKPGGYAGDAPTLDVIYRHPAAPTLEATLIAEDRVLTRYTTSRPASVGVRFRRQILADAIDATAERVRGARCLSLACGHLREAEFSQALATGDIGVLYAIDQDPESLAEVAKSYPHMPIQPIPLGVRDLLRGARPAHDLDFAYSAGLYDYLSDDVASRTTQALFDMLRPGGKLLVANFAPSLPDIGYMESCMDWWLIYRTESDMQNLIRGIEPSLIHSTDVWKDHTGHIVYLEVTRA